MTEPTELAQDKSQEIQTYRSRILDKEFGEVVPSERTTGVVNEVRGMLEESPEATGKFTDLFPQKERIHLAIDGTNSAEFYVVTLYRHHRPEGDADEIKVRRHFVQPIMEVDANHEMTESTTRSEVTSDEVEFFMLGNPADPEPRMLVNIAQEDRDESERINIDFVGECALNGIDMDQLNALSEEQKRKMGMFLVGDALLATREVRSNSRDLMALGLVEYALENGERITVDELHKRTAALKEQTPLV